MFSSENNYHPACTLSLSSHLRLLPSPSIFCRSPCTSQTRSLARRHSGSRAGSSSCWYLRSPRTCTPPPASRHLFQHRAQLPAPRRSPVAEPRHLPRPSVPVGVNREEETLLVLNITHRDTPCSVPHQCSSAHVSGFMEIISCDVHARPSVSCTIETPVFSAGWVTTYI